MSKYTAPASSGSGGAPSGSAGGSLAGSYPNPTIAASAVTTTEIANGTIVDADVNASAAIGYAKLALGGLVSASDIAAAVGAVGGVAKVVYRSGDGNPITANTVLASDSVLTFAMGASDSWIGIAVPAITGANSSGAATTEDLKLSIAAATGATGFWAGIGSAGGGAAVFVAVASSPGAATALGTAGASGIAVGKSLFPLFFYVKGNGSNAGNISVQVAQNTSDASTLVVNEGSFMIAWRVA